MDIMSSTFGDSPVLRCRGTIGTSKINVNAVGVALNWAAIFDTAYNLDVSSSSSDDDGAPVGSGARVIRILGLDVNYNRIYEDVTMNGTTIVTTAKKFLRVFAAYTKTSGAGMSNAGDIYIVKTGTGGTYSTPGVPGTLTSCVLKMITANNLGFSGVFTVPRGCIFAVVSAIAQARGQAGTVSIIQGNAPDTEFKGPFDILKIEVTQQSGNQSPITVWTAKEKTDIYAQAIAASASATINVTLVFQKISGPSYAEV